MSASSISVDRQRLGAVARFFDYVELTKPRISALVLVTVAVSGFVARWGTIEPVLLLNTIFGTILVAASASAVNPLLERDSDSLMQRTASRPLPARRLSSTEVFCFAFATIVFGVVYLALTTNQTTALLGLATWLLYVCVYTPLKSRTHLNTAVGAIAGALPVLMGWAATGAAFDVRALALFLIVFLWQFPHFMAIAWLYRKQYERGGMKMLSVVDPSGRRAGVQAVLGALALIPVSFVPGLLAPGAVVYVVVAFVLGTAQLACAARFFAKLDEAAARLLLRASLVYLPSLLAMLMILPFV